MARLFYHVMQDNVGNLLFDVSGTMRIAGTGTLATIYGDEALTVILPNPMTNHPSFGSFKCFLGAGDYDFYMAKSGYTFETLTGVQGHGTMAQLDASAVAITGGTALDMTSISVENTAGDNVHGLELNVASGGGTNRYNIYAPGQAPSFFAGQLALRGVSPDAFCTLHAYYPKASTSGLVLRPNDNDTGPAPAVQFMNFGGGQVGGIVTTVSTTTYNTTSDARLKTAIAPLTGAVDVVRALNPVSHRWKADDSPGVGFLAHEVAAVVGGVVTGEPDARDDAGQIVPQMMDHSKLVPWLCAAVKELTEQVQVLTAKLEAAGV